MNQVQFDQKTLSNILIFVECENFIRRKCQAEISLWFRKKEKFCENINKFINSSTFESINVDVIVVTKLMTFNERNNVIRRCFFSSINTITSQDKQSSFTTIFTHLKILLSMIDWISNAIAHDKLTSTSSIFFNFSFSIDSKLFNEFYQLIRISQSKN